MIKTNFKKKASMISIITLALITTSLTIPSVANAEVIQPNECFPAVLMLKGSGEGIVNGEPITAKNYIPVNSTTQEPFIHTNGHEGAVIGKALQAFVNQTDPAETVSKVRFIGIDYPALDVFPTIPDMPGVPEGTKAAITAGIWANHLTEYNDSYHAGAKKTVDFIKSDQQRGCNTQYMLMSYSQGVISARIAIGYMGNNADKIISSYVIGDPFQKGNGASSERQYSAANSSRDSNGIGRTALDTLIKAGELNPLGDKVALAGLTYYRDSIIGSDPVVYRDDIVNRNGVETREVSRSLCHYFDPTCDPSLLPLIVDPSFPIMDQHTRYFHSENDSGQLDLDFEIAEFDKQVKTLANSTQATNPRERILTKSPSLAGGATSYNIANARSDDKCSWDKDSNGTQEVVNVPCEIYTVANDTGNVKMTVTITDSFGISHILESEVKTFNPEVIDEIVDSVSDLPTDTWYRFAPKEHPGCLGARRTYTYTPFAEPTLTKENGCSYSNTLFRILPFQTSDGLKLRLISSTSGAAQASPIFIGTSKGSSVARSMQKVAFTGTGTSPTQNFEAILAEVSDNFYYTLKVDGKCVTSAAYGLADDTELKECNPSDNNQLFRATPQGKVQ